MEIITPKKPEYAGFMLRLAAHIIDRIVIGIVTMILFIPFGIISGLTAFLADFEHWKEESNIAFILALIGSLFVLLFISVIIVWLYYALMESYKGGTLGKLLLNIKVTDLNGDKISFTRATGRHFCKMISGILFIGYIMTAFTPFKQSLHDILAKCLVVKNWSYFLN